MSGEAEKGGERKRRWMGTVELSPGAFMISAVHSV